MAFAALGTRASGPIAMDDGSTIATSYPGFMEALMALGGRIEPGTAGDGGGRRGTAPTRRIASAPRRAVTPAPRRAGTRRAAQASRRRRDS
jgi:hypothetical protein